MADWLSRYPHTELVPVREVRKYIQVHRDSPASRSDIERLKASIAQEGIREPLMLTYHSREDTATLGEGHHRLLAAEALGLKEVPVRVTRNEHDSLKGDRRYMPSVPVPKAPFKKHGYYVPADLKPSDIGIPSRPVPKAATPTQDGHSVTSHHSTSGDHASGWAAWRAKQGK